jgi:prophage antirepressor-like protein
MTSIFNFNGTDLRTIEIEGAPWFCGADVLTILYGKAQGKAQMYRQIGADEKRKVTHADLSYHNKPAWIVSESGLYKLIMRSDKATARPFQDWVTKVVLPSIRKTGGYQASDEQPMDPLMQGLSQFLSGLLEKVQAPLVARLEQQEAVIVSLKDHIEKLASGDSPVELWFGVPVREMSDSHIRNAIRWAKERREPCEHLCRERDRRLAAKRAA